MLNSPTANLSAEPSKQPLCRFPDVLEVQRDRLRAAEGTGKANEQQGAVASGHSRVPASGAIPVMRSAVAGIFLLGAAPRERRIPRTVARTRSLPAGKGKPVSDRSNEAADGGRPDLTLGFMGKESRHAFR